MTAGLLYDRVLKRLGDGVLRQLASPGLVLRYVTPELVEHVLAPALGLHGLAGNAAKEALDKLAAHPWLVTRDSATGRVWHRRDLRRSMLRPMLGQPAADRVSVTAAAFFAQGDADAQREAVYHRLLLRPTPEGTDPATVPTADREAYRRMEPHELKDAFEAIRPDLDDLPPPASALLRFCSEQTLPDRDVWLLPKEFFDRAYDKAGRRLTRAREFGTALRLIDRQPDGTGGDISHMWELEVLFATANWSRGESLEQEGVVLMHSASQLLLLYWRAVRDLHPTIDPDEVIAAATAVLGRRPLPTSMASIADWLTLTLVLSRQHHPFGLSTGERLSTLLFSFRPPDPDRSALVQHRLFLLGLLADVPIPINPAPSLLPLHPDALAALAARPELAGVRELLTTAATGLRSLRRTATTRSVLARIDALYKHADAWHAAEFVPPADAHPDLFALLRGPDPDFRDPARFALLHAFADTTGYRQLAGLFRAQLPDLPLADLQTDAFAAALTLDAEHALETPVELIDRARRLGPLLDAAAAARPKADRLQWVRDAHRRWDAAVRSLLASRFQNFT